MSNNDDDDDASEVKEQSGDDIELSEIDLGENTSEKCNINSN